MLYKQQKTRYNWSPTKKLRSRREPVSLLPAIVTHTSALVVHGQVTIIFVVSVCLFLCLFVQSFSQPSSIRFGSN